MSANFVVWSNLFGLFAYSRRLKVLFLFVRKNSFDYLEKESLDVRLEVFLAYFDILCWVTYLDVKFDFAILSPSSML